MTYKKKKSTGKIILTIALTLVAVAGIGGFMIYQYFHSPNVDLKSKKETYLYVYSDWKYEDLVNYLDHNSLLKNINSFKWLAEQKKLPKKLKPGRYKLTENLSSNDLVNMLRSGLQEPVRITLHDIRTKAILAGKIGGKIEADSIAIFDILNDESTIKEIGFTTDNIIAVFIPNTYEFNWNTSAKELLSRMMKEHKKFWNQERKSLAAEIALSPAEVSTLAAIVQEETTVESEKPIVAGVYLNRLKIGQTLDADPTLKFALGDFAIKRVLNKDKKVESPYNTYIHAGLPPGPICMPDASSIDAVLHYQHHKYIYFCAKPDFSGKSNYAVTFAEHKKNAREYGKWLDKIGIKR